MLETLLDDRNVAMAKKVRRYLKDAKRTYFVVVGAGHLVGEKGLVALLEDPALQIEQVAATPAEQAVD